jgi:hypothetical protein
MKRLALIATLLSMLAGCSALPLDSIPFLGPPTPTQPSQPTATPFGLPATFTPDLFALNTEAPTTTPPTGTPRITDTPFPTSTPTTRSTITLAPQDVHLFTPSTPLFLPPTLSTRQVVWGTTCQGDRSIKFEVQVKKVRGLRYVLLFVRLQDKYSARNTDWGVGAIMSDNDQGTYFYRLRLDQIPDYQSYEDAWLQYQFVASTVGLTVLGRSIASRDEVSITHCTVFSR